MLDAVPDHALEVVMLVGMGGAFLAVVSLFALGLAGWLGDRLEVALIVSGLVCGVVGLGAAPAVAHRLLAEGQTQMSQAAGGADVQQWPADTTRPGDWKIDGTWVRCYLDGGGAEVLLCAEDTDTFSPYTGTPTS